MSFMGQMYFAPGHRRMMSVNEANDIYQDRQYCNRIFLNSMILSKSFGYALRGILYVTYMSNEKERVQLSEIAAKLSAPKHFLAKIMKEMVKENILVSVKGPHGGFYMNEKTLQTPLIKLMEITGELKQFDNCVLRLRKCNMTDPCPLHKQAEPLQKQWHDLMANTTINDLLNNEQPEFIQSIAVF